MMKIMRMMLRSMMIMATMMMMRTAKMMMMMASPNKELHLCRAVSSAVGTLRPHSIKFLICKIIMMLRMIMIISRRCQPSAWQPVIALLSLSSSSLFAFPSIIIITIIVIVCQERELYRSIRKSWKTSTLAFSWVIDTHRLNLLNTSWWQQWHFIRLPFINHKITNIKDVKTTSEECKTALTSRTIKIVMFVRVG